MEVGRTLRAATPRTWRAWLRKNHAAKREIWLVFPNKASGNKGLTYAQALDEALCYGWIDGIVKSWKPGARVQRFTPRRAGSSPSEMNKAHIRRLVREKRMTRAGLDAVHAYEDVLRPAPLRLAPDVRSALKRSPSAWRNFERFPNDYRRVRIGWIEGARSRRPEFEKRLRYFVRMTKENKRFGAVRD